MKRVASLLCPVILITGLVGCGGGTPAATGAQATDWVDGVCARMIALDHEVAAERADLDAQVSTGGDPKTLLSALAHFLGEVSGFANLAGDDIDRLGIPDLDGDSPSRVHHDIDTLFERVDSETADLTAEVTKAMRDTGSMTEQANSLMDTAGAMTDLDREMRSILTDYRQLQSAFDDASGCQRWVDQLKTPSTTAPSTTTTTTTTTPPTTTTSVPPTTVPETTVPPTTVPETTVPPTTVPPTTVPVTVDPYISVREQYSAAADEIDAKMDQVYTTFYDAQGYIAFRDGPEFCAQMAALEREWDDRMSLIPFPADSVDEALANFAESGVLLGLLDQCAAAPGTRAGVDALLSLIDTENDTYFATVDALRVAIGLPPVNE